MSSHNPATFYVVPKLGPFSQGRLSLPATPLVCGAGRISPSVPTCICNLKLDVPDRANYAFMQMKQFRTAGALGFALIVSIMAAAAQASAAQSRFIQDRLAIGLWVDPPSNQQTDARFAEIAAANFTFVIGNFGAVTPAAVRRQLRLCGRNDLKAIVSMAGLRPDQLPDGRSCWGYFVADEPTPGAFPDLAKTVEKLRQVRPGKLAFINLLPNYAPAWALGTTDYVEHIARFLREVRPDVLSMDHYPMFLPGSDGREGYCQNLEAMRQQSVAAGIPFWNFFNTMPFGPHSDPTEAQLRWQIYTSLAYGAKGVMYFCYWTPAGDEFPKGGAIIRKDGTRTRHYEEARRINAKLKNLGPTLMKLTSTGVLRFHAESPRVMPADSPLRSLGPGEFIVGTFRHRDGRRAVLLVNYDFAYSAWPTVEFAADPRRVTEIDPTTGKERPVADDSPDMPGLQISLDAGEGRLFLLPPKTP